MKNSYTDGFFNVSSINGFLPTRNPLKELPEYYSEMQYVINNLNIIILQPNRIIKEVFLIPDYSLFVENEKDIFVIQSLYRAYTFISSAYTLELSYQKFIKEGTYGKARLLLPEHISKSLIIVSNKLNVYPWLDYHYAYSLGNYVKKDENGSLDWKNLSMACSFTGTPNEVGFIMLHVYINEISPKLVESVLDTVQTMIDYKDEKDEKEKINTRINKSLKDCENAMIEINKRRREMWEASNHSNYNDFRIFIMGIKGNTEIFGDGLIYEGCFNDIPQQYRGQTGAQDNIIPTMDIFTGIVDYYPDNKLTEYLLDLRTYRPVCIQEFLQDLRDYFKENLILENLIKNQNIEGLFHLFNIVDEVYFFRNGHWQFVQKYIMENTKYEYATGGTPITSWLINQIEAVLNYEKVIINVINVTNVTNVTNVINENIEEKYKTKLSNITKSNQDKIKLLQDQVEELNKLNYNVELIYLKNKESNLEDSAL
jgi:indoleamine 2,3-dioxygenase